MGYPQPFKLSKGPDVIIEGLQSLATEIDKLKLLPGNPRKGDIQAVARSLEAFGQRKPIVAISDGTVIAGNHTLQAAQSLGWKKIAVVFVEDNEAKAKAYALADNRTAELGGYDNQALVDLISDVQLLDKELFAATGWENDDLAELIATLELQQLPTSFTDPDEIPDSPPAKTVLGDVWLLGPHQVVCGDSSDPTVLDAAFANRNIGVILTDPPYGINLATDWSKGGGKNYRPVANDDVCFDASLLRLFFASVQEQFWWGANYYHRSLASSDLDGSWLVWDKRTPETDVVIGSGFELCWSATPHKQDVLRYHWTNFTSHTNDGLKRQHPTEKPVALLVEILNRWSPPSCDVADPFGGSGTTLIAAHNTGRTASLIELDAAYVDVICRRFQKHTGIKPINQATNQEHNFLED
jgi:site-specific DNA-methyltransferase (adenine-specific)